MKIITKFTSYLTTRRNGKGGHMNLLNYQIDTKSIGGNHCTDIHTRIRNYPLTEHPFQNEAYNMILTRETLSNLFVKKKL